MKALALLLFLLVVSITGFAQTCPRIYKKGDTLYTDKAPHIQWKLNGNDIPGANGIWHLPTSQGKYSVVAFDTTDVLDYTAPAGKTFSIKGAILTDLLEPFANHSF